MPEKLPPPVACPLCQSPRIEPDPAFPGSLPLYKVRRGLGRWDHPRNAWIVQRTGIPQTSCLPTCGVGSVRLDDYHAMRNEWTTVISGDRLVKFTYVDLPTGEAFMTAQIGGHEVVYPNSSRTDRRL